MSTDRTTQIARESARILLETQSVLFNAAQPFTFTSGRKSPVYTDCRRLISFPQARSCLMDFAVEILEMTGGADRFDFIAGGETAGIPYAAFIAERLRKPMLYVRKQPKGFGRMAQIEGVMAEDIDGKPPRVLLVEDLQTDGGSKKIFIDALRTAGAQIAHSLVIFHYGIFPQSLQNMKDMDMTLYALTTWWDVLEVARDSGTFDPQTLAAVESFLHQPDQWAQEHAG